MATAHLNFLLQLRSDRQVLRRSYKRHTRKDTSTNDVGHRATPFFSFRLPMEASWGAETSRVGRPPVNVIALAPVGCCDGRIGASIAPSRRRTMSNIIRHHKPTQGGHRSLSASREGVMGSRMTRVGCPPPGFDKSSTKVRAIVSCSRANGSTRDFADLFLDMLGALPTSVVAKLGRSCGVVDK